ncbi:hypothetical protein EJ08DRAFT_654377 [Tothia fuscella]|uniref:Uncharacterized protein n=1 Tax=Tothia fuscella TaxID=1048955 RepID=A0A9P4NEV2_9PEZI|nr:hypothetical protein EJ08DRAFT_654377 [Tothia fuscella]
MAIFKIIIAVPVLILGLPVYGLISNYQKARKIGLPILLTLIEPYSPIWWITKPIL